MSPDTRAWLDAFLFTQAVEVPIYVAALRRPAGDVRAPLDGWATHLAAAFGASLITHPVVWFLIPQLPAGSYEAMVVRAETFAVVVEGLYFYALGAMGFRRAMLWSLIANAASAGIGLACRSVFGWP